MSNMNGLELAKKVAEIDSEIGVMLMYTYELDEQQLKEINKDDYVKKPIHMGNLFVTIKREYFAKDCAENSEK